MIAAGDLDEIETPRLAPLPPALSPPPPRPIPTAASGRAWENLLGDDRADPATTRRAPCGSRPARGFATVSSALIALPARRAPSAEPVFRFAAWQPEPAPWRDVRAQP